MTVMEMLETAGIHLVRASSNNGGEYHGACPGCGGTDRFHVWPEQNNGDGSYWCRQCEASGDAIQFLIDFEQMTYKQACDRLGRDPGEQPFRPMAPPTTKKSPAAFAPKACSEPAEVWADHAKKFVDYCHKKLMENKEQLAYLAGRGITEETAAQLRLGWNPENAWRPRKSWGLETILKDDGSPKKLWLPKGLVIPMFSPSGQVLRIRIRRPAPRKPEKPKYYVLPGSSADTLVLGNPKGEAWVIIEAELDGILVWQDAGSLVTVCALGSSSTRPDEKAAGALQSAMVVLDALDYDPAGAKEKKFWTANFPQRRRWPVPVGKDPGEAYAAGVRIHDWILAGLPPRWRIGQSPSVPPEKGGAPEKASSPGIEKGVNVPAEKQKTKANRIQPPETLKTLIDLMEGAPVSIFIRRKRVTLDYPAGWDHKNWDLFGQISQAVFSDSAVFDFLFQLPTGRYGSRNLMNFSGGE